MLTADSTLTDAWANPTLRVRPGNAGTAVATTMPRIDQAVCFVVIFFLTFNIPSTWFEPAYSAKATASPTQTTFVCFVAAFWALARSRFELAPILTAIRREWVLPALLLLITASALWSSDTTATVRESSMFAGLALFGYWLATSFTITSIIGLMACVVTAGVALNGLLIHFTPASAQAFGHWLGAFKDKNVFGRHLAMSILVLLFAARLHRRFRFACYGVLAVEVLMLVKSGSRTAMVAAGLTPMLALVFVAFRARRTLYGAVAIAVPLTLATMVGAIVANIDSLSEQLGRNASLSGRTDIWQAVLDEVPRRPWFGFGWQGFFTDTNGPAKYVYLKVLEVPHAHNALLDMLITLGVVGAVLMALLHIRLLVRGARVIRFYRGTAGLFPIVFTGYAIVSSVTEYGVVRVDIHFVLLIVAIVGAQAGRRDELDRSGAREYARRLGFVPSAPALPRLPLS